MFARSSAASPYAQALREAGKAHDEVVVRRRDAVTTLRRQLTDAKGRPKFNDPADRRVIYASPLVDVAANMDLVRETVECVKAILELTNWHVRLLSKSPLLRNVAELLIDETNFLATVASVQERVIFGLSTGTMNERVSKAIEPDVPTVANRIKALHWFQQNEFRTFAMVCPSLPQDDYAKFARDMRDTLRYELCEHVWAEVVNVRGESFVRTSRALLAAGLEHEAELLSRVSGAGNGPAWQEYARNTFLAHKAILADHPDKLRFLQYTSAETHGWWSKYVQDGAVLLGAHAHKALTFATAPA